MPDSSFLSLFAVGGAALFGLHGAVGLAIKHHFLRKTYLNYACDKVAMLKGEYNSIFPAACAAVIFYCIVLYSYCIYNVVLYFLCMLDVKCS